LGPQTLNTKEDPENEEWQPKISHISTDPLNGLIISSLVKLMMSVIKGVLITVYIKRFSYCRYNTISVTIFLEDLLHKSYLITF